MITITDEAGTSGSVTVESAGEIADAIRGWFPEAPAEVYEAIDKLQGNLVSGSYTGDWETYLAVSVEIS